MPPATTNPQMPPGRVDRVLLLVIACGAAAAELTVGRGEAGGAAGVSGAPPAGVLVAIVALWVVVTLPQARLFRRALGATWHRAATTLALGGLVLATIVVHAVVVTALSHAWPALRATFDGTASAPALFRVVVRHDALVGIIVALMAYALEHEYAARTRRQREALLRDEASRAQLQVLRMQLDPHFLFNSLNAISALVDDDPVAAQRMIEHLSGFLRQTLEHAEHAEITLADEIALVRSYLEIERVRFSGRLAVDIDVDGTLDDALVPMLILQPLVENAVRHGIQPSVEGGIVRVHACADGAGLCVEVTDDGVGVSPAFSLAGSRGLGLRNTAARLVRSYGAAASLRVMAGPRGGTRATVVLPLRRASVSQEMPS